MKQIKTIGLSIFMILTMIGIVLMPAMGDISGTPDEYEVTIESGQNTALLSTNTTFGTVLAGTTQDIADSFNLTNVGNVDSTVNATFTSLNGTVYGFNSTAGPIGGSNFSMALSGQTLVALDNLEGDTDMTSANNVEADAVADIWKVQLIVPSGQAAAVYTGTVELTFADV